MKSGRRKTVYILAALIVLAAGVALVGGTLAYNLGVNQSGAGDTPENGKDYAVSFDYFSESANAYASVVQADSNAIKEGKFWCPGRTEIFYLRIKNNEKFPVECTVKLNVLNTEFGDTLTYSAIIADLLGNNKKNHPSDWAEFKAKADGEKELEVGSHKLLNEYLLVPAAYTESGVNETYVAVAIHMDEKASSIYQNKKMEFTFSIQVDAEYEPGAEWPVSD